MERINIIGAGRLGSTLGHLIHAKSLLRVGAVVNRTLASAEQAVAFIGAGTPSVAIESLPPAEFTLIATPDAMIVDRLKDLLVPRLVETDSVVFHCSGAKSAEVLADARDAGALIGSMHPTKSFADPKRAVATFRGTHCAFDGDLGAYSRLSALFQAMGARVFSLHSEHKSQYHAAAVMVSNYITTLVDCALELYQRAGVERELAEQLIAPILSEAGDMAVRLGCDSALTGPISRGDVETVDAHLRAVSDNTEILDIYRSLGERTLAIAARQGVAEPASLRAISAALRNRTT
ncbi:MAG: Rossmann-like and DUF2520 domain-containing protein [Pseudomonadota bacterium]